MSSYNGRGFLTVLQNGEQGDLVSQFDADGNGNPMPYDAAGNRLGFTETLPGVAEYNGVNATRAVGYGYDGLGRNQLTGESSTITTAQGIPNANYTYAHGYDDAGNATTFRQTSSMMQSYGFDSDNQAVTLPDSLSSPVYDGSGNPVTFSTPAATPSGFGAQGYNGATVQFDPENRLRTIGGTAFTAQYDGDGMRTQKSASGTPVYFLYDGGTLLEEQTFSGSTASLQSLYLTGADGLRSRYFADSQGDRDTYAYSYDPQGSAVQVQLTLNYDFGGNYAENTFCYDAFGQLLGDERVPTGYEAAPFDSVGFGGEYGYYQDIETGLYELGARYYDAGKGRFVTRDPIGYGGGANLYGFCGNNPVNESDPRGTDVVILTWPGGDDAGGSSTGSHSGIAVTWPGSKTGLAEFDYGPANGLSSLDYYRGKEDRGEVVATTDFDPTRPFVFSHNDPDDGPPDSCILVKTTPEQDKLIRQWLLATKTGDEDNPDQREGSFGRYNGVYHQCANYVLAALKAGRVDLSGFHPRPEGIFGAFGYTTSVVTPYELRDWALSSGGEETRYLHHWDNSYLKPRMGPGF